jgi:hypothetical protein
MRSFPRLAVVLVLAALPLAGCDTLNRALGTEKVIPDEFAVVSRAPLAIPPDYQLRPPRPGATPTQESTPTEQAQQAIFKAGDQQAALPDADKLSPGENLLLRQAHAGDAAPGIRETITKEAAAGNGPVDESFVDKLMIWKSSTPDYGDVIDPNQEAQKLKDTQAAVKAGNTPDGNGAPTIERSGTPSLLSTF